MNAVDYKVSELFFASFYDGDGMSENSLEITVSEWGASLWSKRRIYPTPILDVANLNRCLTAASKVLQLIVIHISLCSVALKL